MSQDQIIQVFVTKNGRYQKSINGTGRTFIKETEYKKIQKTNQKLLEKLAKETLKKIENDKKIAKEDTKRYEKENEEQLLKLRKSTEQNKKLRESVDGVSTKKVDINAEKVRSFINDIDSESDSISEKYNEIFIMYSGLVKEKETRVLANKFLRLSVKYDNLNKKYYDLAQKVSKVKIVSKEDETVFENNVKKVDVFEREFEALLSENDTLTTHLIQKDAQKFKKDEERKRKQTLSQKRISKKRNEADLKKDALEKEKQEAERRKDIQSRWDARNRERESSKQEQISESLTNKKQILQGKREKSDKFFSSSLEDQGALTRGAVGLGRGIGKTISAPLNAFGFDFSDEKQFLSTLFSPVTSLAKFGFGKVKSMSQKSQGIDDNSLNSLDDVYSSPIIGKKKQIDFTKVSQKLSPKVRKAGPVGRLFEKGLSKFGIGNSTNNSSSNVNNSNTVTSNSLSQSSQDFNRTDDNEGQINLNPTNNLLHQILKTLKGENFGSDGKNKKSGMLGKLGGIFGSLFSLGGLATIGSLIATGFINDLTKNLKVKKLWDSIFSQNQTNINETNNESVTVSNRLSSTNSKYSDRNKTKKMTDTFLRYKDSPELWKSVGITDEFVNDYYNSSNSNSKNIINDSTISNSLSKNDSKILVSKNSKSSNSISNIQNKSADSLKTVIKSETKKIEKIKDEQESNKKIADDMKDFLLDEFISKFAEKFASFFINNNSGTGKSYMPSTKPL